MCEMVKRLKAMYKWYYYDQFSRCSANENRGKEGEVVEK